MFTRLIVSLFFIPLLFTMSCSKYSTIIIPEKSRPERSPEESSIEMNSVLITDMTCAIPSDAWVVDKSFGPIPSKPVGGWRILDYSTTEYSGRMLTTFQTDAAVLRIPLNLKGWHAVKLGIACPKGYTGALDVRLSGDLHWQRLHVERGFLLGFAVYGQDVLRNDKEGKYLDWWTSYGPQGSPLVEDNAEVYKNDERLSTAQKYLDWQTSFWKQRRVLMDREEPWTMADLTGRDLEVRAPSDMLGRGAKVIANLVSVRAIPMSDKHVQQILNDTSRQLVYFNDGHGIFYIADHLGPEVIEKGLTPFADSEWTTSCFGIGIGDLVYYPDTRGTIMSDGAWDLRTSRSIADKLKGPLQQGWDPLKQVVNMVHTQGQDFWGYIRPQGWVMDWPYDQEIRSKFYGEHINYRCMEADGQSISALSIAYADVRKQLNIMAAEAIERGADGICIALVRGIPLVRYEPPVIDRFRELFGEDARTRPDTDSQLRLVWQEFVEQWLQELREVIDRYPNPEQKRRKLSIVCGADLEWNLLFGVDVGELARKQLVDVIIPYPERRQVPWGGRNHAKGPPNYCEYEPIDINAYVKVLKETETLLLPSLGYHGDHALGFGEYFRRAHRFYKAGAQGLSRWDSHFRLGRMGLNSPARVALWSEIYNSVDHPLWFLEIGGVPLVPYAPSGG